jgi:hypothetical protein
MYQSANQELSVNFAYLSQTLSDLCFSSFLAQQPNAGQGHLIVVVFVLHTMTHRSLLHSSGRVIGWS